MGMEGPRLTMFPGWVSTLGKVMMSSSHDSMSGQTVACPHQVCCPSLPDSGEREDSRVLAFICLFLFWTQASKG